MLHLTRKQWLAALPAMSRRDLHKQMATCRFILSQEFIYTNDDKREAKRRLKIVEDEIVKRANRGK